MLGAVGGCTGTQVANKKDWPACDSDSRVLAQAVPADYAGDALLTNWSKPSYNLIMENTQRDPSTPWQEPSGDWRLHTVDSIVYGTADMLAGKWYDSDAHKYTHCMGAATLHCHCEGSYGFVS